MNKFWCWLFKHEFQLDVRNSDWREQHLYCIKCGSSKLNDIYQVTLDHAKN